MFNPIFLEAPWISALFFKCIRSWSYRRWGILTAYNYAYLLEEDFLNHDYRFLNPFQLMSNHRISAPVKSSLAFKKRRLDYLVCASRLCLPQSYKRIFQRFLRVHKFLIKKILKSIPYSITIVETPGYGNTKGARRDDKEKITRKIKWFLTHAEF